MFNQLTQIPLDPIFKVFGDFQADARPEKINLGIGLYADDAGKAFVPQTIQQAYLDVDTTNFNYAPIGGNRDFLVAAAHWFLGTAFDEEQTALQASCGGTQALWFYNQLMKQTKESPTWMVGHPTWGNHYPLLDFAAPVKVDHLTKDHRFNLKAYREGLEVLPDHSTLLMHGGLTHNPCGVNASLAEWEELYEIINHKHIQVYIDSAYFGFGGSVSDERTYLSTLWQSIDQIAIGCSFSKNASLYEHRTGLLMIKTDRPKVIESQLQHASRASISMPPGIGQEMMLNVFRHHLSDWEQEIDQMRVSLSERRLSLVDELPDSFSYLRDGAGMFSLLPFTLEQVEQLKKEHAIYLPPNARINIAGLTPDNNAVVANAFVNVF